jgi:hypothetical protein
MGKNYLFGPFVGEVKYELNYFVGHAIYLRKKSPRSKIIVLTRSTNFDLYGRYATTLIPLPLSDEFKPNGFFCENMHPLAYDQILKKFVDKYRGEFRIHEHFYPKVNTYMKNIKWYYHRDEVDFDFKPRPRNRTIALEIAKSFEDIILTDHHDTFQKFRDYRLVPMHYFRKKLNLKKSTDATILGILIEMIRLSKYVYSDIDSILGRLAMLLCKPLITKRNFIDAHYLHPINPYGSIVIGCQKLEDGMKYFGGLRCE